MPVYVAEIAGEGVAALNAASELEAEGVFQSDCDLSCYHRVDGSALWDGTAKIFIRAAFPEEYAKWDASYARAVQAHEIADGEEWVEFLVAVTDPTDAI